MCAIEAPNTRVCAWPARSTGYIYAPCAWTTPSWRQDTRLRKIPLNVNAKWRLSDVFTQVYVTCDVTCDATDAQDAFMTSPYNDDAYTWRLWRLLMVPWRMLCNLDLYLAPLTHLSPPGHNPGACDAPKYQIRWSQVPSWRLTIPLGAFR